MGTVSRITSWSYSRYMDYVQCPLKAKLKHVDKLKEPPNDAMTRGSSIGRMAEEYLKGKLAKMPKELVKFKKDFQDGKKLVAKKLVLTVVEDTWAFAKDWSKSRWDDWKNCWLRVKLDWAYSKDGETMQVVDWKTGKFRPEDVEKYTEQLQLYCLAGLLLHPHIKKVTAVLKYLDLGLTYPDSARAEQPISYGREDIDDLVKLWEKRTKAMLSDTTFAPKPNRFCAWCFFRKDNAANGGGQCKY